jgi:hypothetical protein
MEDSQTSSIRELHMSIVANMMLCINARRAACCRGPFHRYCPPCRPSVGFCHHSSAAVITPQASIINHIEPPARASSLPLSPDPSFCIFCRLCVLHPRGERCLSVQYRLCRIRLRIASTRALQSGCSSSTLLTRRRHLSRLLRPVELCLTTSDPHSPFTAATAHTTTSCGASVCGHYTSLSAQGVLNCQLSPHFRPTTPQTSTTMRS